MAAVLSHQSSTRPKPKTHVSIARLPAFISSKEPPTKKSPWRQIRDMPFISSMSLTLPSRLHDLLWPLLQSSTLSMTPRYAKVIFKLIDILTGDFFNTYIKTRTILLISEGVPGVSDWVCTLHDGQLRLEMAREVYERCGIQGVPADRNGGARKHGRDRWVIELNLREPAMVSGRKGFERLIRAAEQVLNQSRVWLFQDLGKDDEMGETPISGFHPTVVKIEPEILDRKNILVPNEVSTYQDTTNSTPPPPPELHEDYHELIEWLDLVNLDSSCVTSANAPDPYISRYTVPEAETATATDLKVVRWTGLLDRTWCMGLLIEILRLSRGLDVDGCWVACCITAHRTEALGQVDGCTMLLRPSIQEGTEKTTADNVVARDQEGDVVMDEGRTSHGGLTHCTCFQFVDTLL